MRAGGALSDRPGPKGVSGLSGFVEPQVIKAFGDASSAGIARGRAVASR
jgi:hypothetical protein